MSAGIARAPRGSEYSLKRLIYVTMAGRALAVGFYLLLSVLFQNIDALPTPIYSMVPVGMTLALTLVYFAALPYVGDLRAFIILHIALDILLVTLILIYSGGAMSPFSPLYLLVILSSTALLERDLIHATGLGCALVSLALNAAERWVGFSESVVGLNLARLSPSETHLKFLISAALYLVAAYSLGHLADRLKRGRELYEATSADYSTLKEFYEIVVESIEAGLIALDMGKRIVSINRAGAAILRLGAKDRIGAPISEILDSDPIDADLDRALGAARSTSNSTLETTLKAADGARIELELLISPNVRRGETIGALILLRDVTARNAADRIEQESKRLELLGRFSAVVAHEVRNPLASLSGSIEVIREQIADHLDESGARLFSIVDREVARLNRITTNYLNLSSESAPGLYPIDISKTLADTVELIRSSERGDRRAQARVDLAIEPELFVRIDQESFERLVWNLLTNAFQSLGVDGRVSLRAERSLDCETISIELTDNGVGIEPDKIGKIFDPFYTTRRGGSGLGLSTAKRIVENARGSIRIRSEPGRGTSCAIELPAAKFDRDPQSEPDLARQNLSEERRAIGIDPGTAL